MTQVQDATLGFFDISGFTTLSERLERSGRVGTELTTEAINGVLAPAIDCVLNAGGDVLTFGGDAISVLFTGQHHERRATWCAAEVQRVVRARGRHPTPAGPVRLQMSAGLHVGAPILVAVPGAGYVPAFVCGQAVTRTLDLESAAAPGTVRMSFELAARLPRSWSTEQPDGSFLLRLAAPRPVEPVLDAPETSRRAFRLLPRLAAALDARPIAEHRPSAVAFVALFGTDGLEPEELEARVGAMARAVGDACEAYGICSLDTDLGSDQVRIMLTAGAPVLSERDEERLLLAVRDLADSGLGLRIGANRGRVFAGELGHPRRATYTLMGDAVNVAARLMARSEPDRPLVGLSLLERSVRPFAVGAELNLRVKNRREPVLAAVLGSVQSSPNARPERGRLLGRDDELAVLAQLVQNGGATVISAPAGSGKSRLVEAAAHAAPSHRVLWLIGDPYSSTAAYGPFAEIVDDSMRARVGAGDESLRRARLHQAVLERLAGPDPVLLVAEDLHWFDDASLELIGRLAAVAGERGWTVLATTRPHQDLLPEVPRLELGPLPPSSAATLAIQLAGDVPLSDATVTDLVGRSGGNPLFLRELVLATSSGADLPDNVEQLIGARIDELDPADRRLLRSVAVAGREADLDVIAAVQRDPAVRLPSAWDGLTAFVKIEAGRLRFDHALVQAVAYEGLPFHLRSELHGKYADRLVMKARTDPAVLARHYRLGERHADAWRWSIEAGVRARSSGAWVEAADHYAAALAAGSRIDPPLDLVDLAEVNEDLGDVSERLGLGEQAMAAYRLALLGAVPASDRSRLLRKQGRVHERCGRYVAAFRRFGAALREVETAGPSSERAAAQLGQAVIRFRQGHTADAVRLAEAARAASVQAGDQAQLAQSHLVLEMAGSRAEKAAHGEAALRLFEELGDDLGLGNLLVNLGVTAYDEGDWDASLARYERATTAFQRAGDVVGTAMIVNNRAEILTDQGRYAEAQECLAHAARAFAAAGHAIGVTATISSQSRLALREGHLDRALDLNSDARRRFADLGADEFVLDTDARRVEILAHLGDPEQALELAMPLAPAVDAFGGLPVVALALRRYRAIALARAGRGDEAHAAVDEALAAARGTDVLSEQALLLAARTWLGGSPGDQELAELQRRLGMIGLPELPTLHVPA